MGRDALINSKSSINIQIDDWIDILNRLQWLDALEAAGVDNWEGIDEARNIYAKWGEEDDELF